ncbi:MAG: hypothetical protein ACI8RN_001715 [Glaciecola sp.]|jgi:hypothetical protein
MQVLGAGVGRTGTMSLRTALQQLGLGPCHHMDAVLQDMAAQVPLWVAALDDKPDWPAIYAGQQSAVDWPTASFYSELHATYPDAKFILTHRDPNAWVESFSETIMTALGGRSEAPPELHAWMDMALAVIARAGFCHGMSNDEFAVGFEAHNAAVQAAIPASHLLEFQVKEGWGPLCDFLGVDVPEGEFPRTNDRKQFWELMEEGGA